MRRIVQSFAVIGLLALGACGGGGSVLSFDTNTNPDRVIVTTVGPSNIARVLPGASIALSATAVRGSQNGLVNVNRYTWSAAVTVGGTYIANTDGQTKPCATLVFTPTGGTPVAFAPDYSIYIAIDPTNEANILFIPPTAVVGSTNPYCVVVTATPRGGSAANAGSITVAVVNPNNPLN